MGYYDDSIGWLLGGEPHVRYNTLVNVLGRRRGDLEVDSALAGMMASPPVSKILSRQEQDGGFLDAKAVRDWGPSAARAGYFPKYRGSAWKLIFLAQLGADPGDQRVRDLSEYLLRNAYNPELGAFKLTVDRGNMLVGSYIMPCWIGNMVHAMTVLGFGDRPEVLSSLDFLVRYQRFDDGGWRTPDEYPYRGRRDHCWGRHTCYWGVTKFLRALSVVDERYKTAEVRSAERRAIDFALLHHLIWSSHNQSKPITTNNTRPTRLTAPLTYYDDAVEIATALLALGVRGPEVDEAVEYVLSKRTPDGRWTADNTPGPLDSPFASKGEESRWVTYRVLRMLRLAGRL